MAGWEVPLNWVLLAWGLLWWFLGGLGELDRHLPEWFLQGGRLLLVAGSCTLCHFLERRLRWPPLVWPALGIVPALWFLLLSAGAHPLADGGALSWPLALAALYLILYQREGEDERALRPLHAAALWLLAALGTWELLWRLSERLVHPGSWLVDAWVVLPDLLLIVLARWGMRPPWPVPRHREGYLALGAAPLALWSFLWIVVANLHTAGDPYPFPWFPVANVLDAAVLISLWALLLWYRRFRELPGAVFSRYRAGVLPSLYGAAVFVWLNALLARALHYWEEVPLDAASLFGSSLAQSSYAVFWAVLSLCVMVVGSRRRMRRLWFSGGALLAVVVLKLFVIDLAGQGTVERIVSFVAVGVLLLVIGWFSPVPPP